MDLFTGIISVIWILLYLGTLVLSVPESPEDSYHKWL